MRYKTLLIWSTTLLLLFSLGFVTNISDNYFEISKNLDIFGKLYREVNALYVDETDPTELMRTGIDAMLESLDPYTSYISEKEIEDFRVMSTGQYGGIGATIGKRNGKIVILEPYEYDPAHKAGLRAGDELLEIDGKPLRPDEMKVVEVRNLLRGEKGSTIRLTVARKDRPKPLRFELVRDRIWVKNVPYYGMIDDKIGYIALSGFSRRAAQEVEDALHSLKQKHAGLKGVILDLRGNPGGRLDESVKVANIFLPQNEVIVETRGRSEHAGRTHRATREPVDTHIPLAVLVNARSASASEIVAGALQDLDRAVIVGQKSFGKGLVQNIRPLSYNTQLKVTSAKYYTPSGRCIQALDYAHKNAKGEATRIPDSIRTTFKTRNGRSVMDGGGIEPDVPVEKAPLAPMVQALEKEGLIFDFATRYAAHHKRIAPPQSFEVDEATFEDFLAFVKAEGFDYHSPVDEQLAALKKAVEGEAYLKEVADDIEQLGKEVATLENKDLHRYRESINWLLKQEILSRYYFRKGPILASFQHDAEIREALRVLRSDVTYHKLLQPRDP
ncbi:MAG: S41 family peptidase [Bacteroidetes bacterium]|nr:MAG: S41 family peptidase [Bacteroidota bacterium]